MTLFSNNLWWLSTYVNRGDLDYYLVRPVSSLFFVSLRDFAANSFVNLLMACSLLAWTITNCDQAIKWWAPALYVLLLISRRGIRA